MNLDEIIGLVGNTAKRVPNVAGGIDQGLSITGRKHSFTDQRIDLANEGLELVTGGVDAASVKLVYDGIKLPDK